MVNSAGANPSRDNDPAKKEPARGRAILEVPVCLFVGEEDHVKEKAVRQLKRALLARETAELNYNVFYGDDSGAREILDCAATLPFFSGKRLVVVKKAEKLTHEDAKLIASYAAAPQRATCLVLCSSDDSILGALYDPDHVRVVRFDRIPAFTLSHRIREAVAVYGKTIDDESVELLKELFGHSEGEILEREIEKLGSFVGTRPRIGVHDVETVAGRGLANSTFELTDAIGRGDVAGALRVLQDSPSTPASRYSDIVGLIAWHLRTLSKGMRLAARGTSTSALARTLRIPRRLEKDFLTRLKKFEAGGLSSKLEILLRADLDMKTGRMDSRSAIETAIVRLCLR